MSEAMKKPRTNGVKIKIGDKKPRLFVVPKDEAKGLMQMLQKYEIKDSVDWRKSLSDVIENHSEGGAILKAERSIASLTQVALAKKLGVPQHVISEMENGKRPIGKKMATRLSKVFKSDYRLFL